MRSGRGCTTCDVLGGCVQDGTDPRTNARVHVLYHATPSGFDGTTEAAPKCAAANKRAASSGARSAAGRKAGGGSRAPAAAAAAAAAAARAPPQAARAPPQPAFRAAVPDSVGAETRAGQAGSAPKAHTQSRGAISAFV